MNPYTEMGYADRAAYLRSLAEEYGLLIVEVEAMADLLGPSEDFDGLVNACRDATR